MNFHRTFCPTDSPVPPPVTSAILPVRSKICDGLKLSFEKSAFVALVVMVSLCESLLCACVW